jgi:RNA polymerase sigma factor (TIGR02999 family)
MSDATHFLRAIEQGEPRAAAELLPLVYDELRRLAARRLTQQRPGPTLEPAALVHQAHARLVGGHENLSWAGRKHCYAAAAAAMRKILIENARRKRGPRRGGRCAGSKPTSTGSRFTTPTWTSSP